MRHKIPVAVSVVLLSLGAVVGTQLFATAQSVGGPELGGGSPPAVPFVPGPDDHAGQDISVGSVTATDDTGCAVQVDSTADVCVGSNTVPYMVTFTGAADFSSAGGVGCQVLTFACNGIARGETGPCLGCADLIQGDSDWTCWCGARADDICTVQACCHDTTICDEPANISFTLQVFR